MKVHFEYLCICWCQLFKHTPLQFHPGPARKLSTNLYDIRVYQCRMYSE